MEVGSRQLAVGSLEFDAWWHVGPAAPEGSWQLAVGSWQSEV